MKCKTLTGGYHESSRLCESEHKRTAREGISLDNQIAKIRAYAELNELELLEVIEDAGRSGKSLDREGAQRLISMCQAGEVSHVIVYKLDRIQELRQQGLSLAKIAGVMDAERASEPKEAALGEPAQ